MNFLVFIALCFVATQALVIQSPGVTTYASYATGVAPVYHTSVAYSPHVTASTIVRSTYTAPALVYSSPILRTTYAAPTVYGVSSLGYTVPSVYGTILKK